MVLSEFNGSKTMTGAEDNLFVSQTTLKHYATHVFLHNMTSTDTIIIRVYVKDVDTGVEKLFITATATGVQSDPDVFVPFLPTSSYRVTCEQTAGTNRAIPWTRNEA